MRLIDMPNIKTLIETVTLREFYLQLVQYLRVDFAQWEQFQKSARYAAYVPNGVVELMPVCGPELFGFKYVNGHPENPKTNRLSVVAFGALTSVATGYPLMISEMTLLTALRTAAISALASQCLARANSKTLTIIGCGAQSEFQVLAHHALFDLEKVYYYDLDPKAMQRFTRNLQGQTFELIAGNDAESIVRKADIIVTATAAKGKQAVLQNAWLQPGQHISGIGGDSPGKTELEISILERAKIVVEYFPQTVHEGEIQNLGERAQEQVYAELWEIIVGNKPGRVSDTEITLFDDVGFALEDYSILRLVYELAQQHNIGQEVDLIPEGLDDCKDLFRLLVEAR